MARAGAAVRKRRPHSTQNDENRARLLDAARAVVLRDGYNAASFSSIAQEAGLQREAVFTYFRSKDELVVATVADDLTALARSMREAVDVKSSNAEPDEHQEAAPAHQGRREAALARVRETLNKPETLPVDAWLERRLRVFEKTLADLDARQSAVERTGQTAVESALENAAVLREEMRKLEKAQHDAALSLRNQVLDVSGRLEVVERQTAPNLTDAFAVGQIASVSADNVDEDSPDIEPQQDVPVSAPEPESYLSAARRAAMAAAILSDIEEKPHARFAHYLRAPYIYYAGGVALVLALLLTGLLLNHATAHSSSSVKAQASNIALAAGPGFADKRKTRRGVSLERLEALAKGGTAHAALILGLKYLDGNGVARDDALAARWLQVGAAQGEPLAQYKLATLYRHGQGVAKDLDAALRWYESAAMQGNREAMHDLAMAYAEGWGTEADPKEAARWFARAASFGFVNSQFNLAVVYERGFGVKQSLTEAYKWYAIAAANGDAEAQTRVDALKTQIPAHDLAVAQAKADAFKPMPLSRSANMAPQLPVRARG